MPNSLTAWTESCMKRIFLDAKPPRAPSREISLSAAANEYECFQVGLCSPGKELRGLRAEATALCGAKAEIPPDCTEALWADYVPVHWRSANNDPGDLEGKAPGFYPDPLHRHLPETHPRGVAPSVRSAWVRIHVPPDTPAGSYRGRLTIQSSAGKANISIRLKVWPFALPSTSRFLMTNWFNADIISRFTGVTPLTDEFWATMELYAKNMAEHRQNVFITPLFRFSSTEETRDGRPCCQLIAIQKGRGNRYNFDFTNFDRWVELFLSHGFSLIEGGHLAGGSKNVAGFVFQESPKSPFIPHPAMTTDSPGYRRFLQQFLQSLTEHLRTKSWMDRFVLHLSDEPGGDQFPLYESLANFVKENAPEVRIIDAMGHPEYASLIHHPVPLENRYEDFVEAAEAPKENVWFYYCCGPTGPWPNRFIDFPLIRVRIFTWLAFKHNIPGFLHWGYAHWGWHPPVRKQPYNPYDNTTGGVLQAGDSYVVYPPYNPDVSKEPVDSIRWEIIREAMEDHEYLSILKEAIAENEVSSSKKAKQSCRQGRALLREVGRRVVPSFTTHTRNAEYLLRLRERIGDSIAELTKYSDL